ncbi:MAG: hypothetical protein COW12_07985 [Candidatus Omnitrophica bacterium CG12_big_fil_rev_8_21_14_0_65_45_16]|nr:MAG: hypothetical protein COW12_07985 [Candidatus Omnitrophica bacterium CG12_big_fil_rev_8_21_14_0_65_45_16]
MTILLYLIALLWMFTGAAALFAPESTKMYVEKLSNTENTKFLSILPFVFAVVLLLGSGQTTFPMYCQVMGVLAALKGVLCLVLDKEKLKTIMDWYLKMPALAFRMAGFVSGALALILYKIIA